MSVNCVLILATAEIEMCLFLRWMRQNVPPEQNISLFILKGWIGWI